MKTTLYLNASALGESDCELKFHNIVIAGLTQPLARRDTQFGSAFHKFMSRMFETGGNIAEAHTASLEVMRKPCIEVDKKDWMSEKALIPLCLDYWETVISKDNFYRLVNSNAKCWKCGGKGRYNRIPDADNLSDELINCSVCNGSCTREQPLVEATFMHRLHEDDELIIEGVGTLDSVGQIRNGAYCIQDFKTTSSWKIDEFLENFRRITSTILLSLGS